MRKLFLKDYIIDSDGFIINREGDVLPTYEDSYGDIYSIIDSRLFYLADLIEDYDKPIFKGIKFLKKSEKWKTYVNTSAQKIEDNKTFDTQYEAAEWVNILYGKYGLDRIYNPVPKPQEGEYEEYSIPKCGDTYLVTSLGSVWIKAGQDYVLLGKGKSVVYITNKEGKRKEFVVSDLVKLIMGD